MDGYGSSVIPALQKQNKQEKEASLDYIKPTSKQSQTKEELKQTNNKINKQFLAHGMGLELCWLLVGLSSSLCLSPALFFLF